MRFHGSHGSKYEDDNLFDIAPCSLVEIGDVSEARTASIIMAMMLEAVRTSETLAYFKETLYLKRLSSSKSPP